MHTTLVSTSELEAHLHDPTWLVLDCQHDLLDHAFGRAAYAREHIPNAHFVSMEDDMAGKKTGSNGRHPLPTLESLKSLFCRLGVAPGRQVVVYDQAQNNYAGRVWWTLRYLGHRGVAVLDGALGKWKSESRPLTSEVPPLPPSPTELRGQPNDGLHVVVESIVARLGEPDLQLIDARTAERYRGEAEPIDPVAGHIPGALLRFWKDNIEADGSFKSPHALRAEFTELLGDRDPSQVVHQCGSGVTACHNLLAMEIAGLPGAKLYVGSWSEWCADPKRPVAIGATP